MAWIPVEQPGGATAGRRASEWLVRVTGAPALDAQQWRVVGLVSIGTLFGQYDRRSLSGTGGSDPIGARFRCCCSACSRSPS